MLFFAARHVFQASPCAGLSSPEKSLVRVFDAAAVRPALFRVDARFVAARFFAARLVAVRFAGVLLAAARFVTAPRFVADLRDEARLVARFAVVRFVAARLVRLRLAAPPLAADRVLLEPAFEPARCRVLLMAPLRSLAVALIDPVLELFAMTLTSLDVALTVVGGCECLPETGRSACTRHASGFVRRRKSPPMHVVQSLLSIADVHRSVSSCVSFPVG